MRVSTPRHRDRQLYRHPALLGLLLAFCLFTSSAYAQCTSPPGNDGTKEWFAESAGSGPTGCSNIGDVCSDGSVFAGDTDLYAADVDQGTGIQWSTVSQNNTGSRSDTDGAANQAWIVANQTLSQYPAFQLCENLNRHSHTDWYLPARNELNILYTNRPAIGGFADANYWSSTEDSNTLAWSQLFFNGNPFNYSKANGLEVRCVRRDSGGVATAGTYKFCIDGNWVDLTEDGTLGACSTEADWDYDTGEKAFKQCDGTDWKKITCAAGGGGSSCAGLTTISAGTVHSCGLGTDAKAYCWGGGGTGQLGNNSTSNQDEPVEVHAGEGPGTYTQVSAAVNYTCGLGTDGKAYCWGLNNVGQLGDNSTTNRPEPVEVHAGEGPGTYTQVSAGEFHGCGLGTDGKAYCWGGNYYGELGDNSTTNRPEPVEVHAGEGSGIFSQVSAGNYFSCGLGTDSKVYCWGLGGNGRLGNNSTSNQDEPVEVHSGEGPGTYTQLSSGAFAYSCGVGTNGKAYCWGLNTYGQLGDNTTTTRPEPVEVHAGEGLGIFTQVSAGRSHHTCGIGIDDKTYCWGYNGYGQLGDNSTTQRNEPVEVHAGEGPGTLAQVSAGGNIFYQHSCGLGADGKAYCWGNNQFGQLGDNTTTQRNESVEVHAGEGPGTFAVPSCGSGGGGSCTSLGSCSVEGRMEYDNAGGVMMYCDGADWYPLVEGSP